LSTIRGDIANLYPVRQGQLKTAPFKAAPFKAAVNLDGGLADLDDVGSASGPAVRHALAAIGSGRRVLELAPPDMTMPDTTGLDTTGPQDLDGPGGNVRL
jgi:hypothetical protein